MKEMYRRKDFYVLFALLVAVTFLLGTINFFNDEHIVRFIKEAAFLLIWISSLVIVITTTARQIPAERESRTIFPLLAKPVGRGEVVVGKFLGCWFAGGIALIVFYFFFGVMTASLEHKLPILADLQALWLHWMGLGIVAAMVMFGSVVFTAPSSNITISFLVVLGIMFAGGHLNSVAIQMRGISGTIVYAIYYAIPHLELYDIRDLVVHDWGLVDWTACLGASAYAFIYMALMLGCAWVVFRKKTVTL